MSNGESPRYRVLGSGRRIGASLVMEFCHMFGGSDDAALPFTALSIPFPKKE